MHAQGDPKRQPPPASDAAPFPGQKQGRPDHDQHKHGHHDECAHAAQQRARAPDALARAEARCLDRQVRLTPLRRRVLAALYATHRPLGAYDLIERLADAGERRLAPVSIYRTLDFLQENELAHRIESLNAFVACPHDHATDDVVVFLMCAACGGVDEIASAGLSVELAQVAAQAGFTAERRIVEMSGRCAHCHATTTQPDA